MKIYLHDAGHMARMTATWHPYMVKILQNFLLQNQLTNFLVTCRVLSNDDPGLTLIFYGKVKFCNFGFSVGISEESGFF